MCNAEQNKQNEEVEHQDKVSSTQATTEELSADSNAPKHVEEKVVVKPLPEAHVKPQTNRFTLFSYTGDSDKVKIANWIRLYESLGQRASWSHDELKWNLASYLEGQAFDFYIEHVLAKEHDWNEARQTMLDRFNKYDVEPYMEFLSFKWSPQITLKEYFNKMRALAYDASIDTKETLLGLTRGLPLHLRTEMSTATTLRQWCAIATCLQQRLEESSHYNKHNSWKAGRRNGNNSHANRNQKRHQNQASDHQNAPQHNTSNHAIEHEL